LHFDKKQARIQLGTPEGGKSFLGGAQISKLCPTHFSKGVKKLGVGFIPLVTGLIKTNKFSFLEMLRKEHICDRLRKSCTTVE